jgi:hypothetical protein
MSKKNKRSVRSQRSSFNPLNDTDLNPGFEDKREESFPENMDLRRDEIGAEEPELKNIPEEEIKDLVEEVEVPTYDLKQIPSEPDVSFPPRYRKNPPTGPVHSQRSMSATSMFSLSNPMMKYGLMAMGVFALIAIFLGLKKSSKSGPVVVEIKEGADGEKKSVRNSVNRVSSPRIVFGDLRKNPSLMVAPPMTPGAGK